MRLTIIAALNRRGVIGRNGGIPWRNAEDMARFKQLTTGHTVVMGRRTFESIGHALPERRNIVLSGSRASFTGAERAASMEEVMAMVRNDAEVYVIGGGELFRQTIVMADVLELTMEQNDEEGEVFFPPRDEWNGSLFRLERTEQHDGFRYETHLRAADRPAVQ